MTGRLQKHTGFVGNVSWLFFTTRFTPSATFALGATSLLMRHNPLLYFRSLCGHQARRDDSAGAHNARSLGGHLNPAIEGHLKSGQRGTHRSLAAAAWLPGQAGVGSAGCNAKKNKGNREKDVEISGRWVR